MPKHWRAKNLVILSENHDTTILTNFNLAVWSCQFVMTSKRKMGKAPGISPPLSALPLPSPHGVRVSPLLFFFTKTLVEPSRSKTSCSQLRATRYAR